MEFINNLKIEYATQKSAYENEKTRIETKIAKLEKKLQKLVYPHWTDLLVRPIIEEVARRTPDIVWEDNKPLSTFGMRCECPIFGKTSKGYTVGITFTPDGETLCFDTGEKHHLTEYNDWNGFNNVSKPVESIDELIALVRKQEQQNINKQKTTSSN